MLATPVGINLDIYSAQESGDKWKKNQFGTPDPILVLFKNIPMLYKAYKAGFVFPKLQIGGIGGGHGRTNVVGPIALDRQDGVMINELANEGMEIYFQPTPDSPHATWPDVKRKFFSDLP